MISPWINKPYCLNSNDWDYIKKHFSRGHKAWEEKDFKSFKKNLIKHLRGQQTNRCCYCKVKLRYDKKSVEIEHIIPKAKAQRYTFLNYNLALSCPSCNTTKHEDFPVVGKKTVVRTRLGSGQWEKNITFLNFNFPYRSSNYYIVHPHFDNYFEHLEIIKEIFIRPKSKKGRWTYNSCELYSLQKAQDKVTDLKRSKNDIKSLIYNLVIDPDYPEIKQTVNDMIDSIKSGAFQID